MTPYRIWTVLSAALLVLAACAPAASPSSPTPDLSALEPQADVTEEAYFIPSLGFDSIRPIYTPVFAAAGELETVADDDLIIGVALGDEAKAYPLKVLRFREMVNDEIDGRPILVTF